MRIFNKVFVLAHDNLTFYRFYFVPCAPPMPPSSPCPPRRLSQPPSPSYKRPWRCLLLKAEWACVSGMLSGWISQLPLASRTCHTQVTGLLLHWLGAKGLTCDTWYHFVGSNRSFPSKFNLVSFDGHHTVVAFVFGCEGFAQVNL